MNMFERTKALIGDDSFKRISRAHVILCGVGGVGGYTLEALVRAGIGKITVIDGDVVSESNLNRQIIATRDTIGKKKVEAAELRAKSINPDIGFVGIGTYLSRDNAGSVLSDSDFIIDAIDSVPAKVAMAVYAHSRKIPIISCLGTGNRTDATKFMICDIYETSACPLARKMRAELKKTDVRHLDVLFSSADVITPSDEISDGKRTVGSVSYVPSVAGLLIAQHVITKFTEDR